MSPFSKYPTLIGLSIYWHSANYLFYIGE